MSLKSLPRRDWRAIGEASAPEIPKERRKEQRWELYDLYKA